MMLNKTGCSLCLISLVAQTNPYDDLPQDFKELTGPGSRLLSFCLDAPKRTNLINHITAKFTRGNE